MQYSWLYLILSLICFLNLEAEEQLDPFVSSLVNTQNLLSMTVQSISTISGEWLESETDFIVQGPEPLVLTRSYAAGYSSGTLGYNWEFNRPHPLIVHSTYTKDFDKTNFIARLHHPSGIKTIHKAEKSKHGTTNLPLYRTRALTNCRSDEII